MPQIIECARAFSILEFGFGELLDQSSWNLAGLSADVRWRIRQFQIMKRYRGVKYKWNQKEWTIVEKKYIERKNIIRTKEKLVVFDSYVHAEKYRVRSTPQKNQK